MSRAEFPYLGERDRFQFPAPERASPEGIVAAGGNVSPGMLLSAYSQGIFPWFSEYDPILWWSPDPRFVLFPQKLHVSKTMRKFLRRSLLFFTVDEAFDEVIVACAKAPRRHQDGTWITNEMLAGYQEMHRLGYAHSVEVWEPSANGAETHSDRGRLVGGLYGVSLGRVFFGESMFSRASNASKAAFIVLVRRLIDENFQLIDSQVYTKHLESLGAEDISREHYLEVLQQGLSYPTFKGTWRGLLDPELPWEPRAVRIAAPRS